MKKIIASLMAVVVAVGSIAVGTRAYFTDTETSTGNTFTTGTIDIAVDGQNPWSRSTPYALTDMKPGYVDYVRFTLQNVGDNPSNVWKDIEVTGHENGPVSEPEAAAEAVSGPITDLENVINYDLNVKLYNEQNVMVWEQMIYDEDITMADAYAAGRLYLGMIPVGWHMDVEQSYRMDEEAGNEYQGDTITFDITIDAEQLVNTVRLENKDTSDWQLLLADGIYAELTYGVKESAFEYQLNTHGLTAGSYTLFAWEDNGTWPWANRTSALALANITAVGGDESFSDSIDINQDLTSSKVWLVPGTFTPGTTGHNLPWSPASTLFETGLVDYYDADL